MEFSKNPGKVIVTRPFFESEKFIEKVQSRSSSIVQFEALIGPLLDIEPCDFELARLKKRDAVIITSMNAAKVLRDVAFKSTDKEFLAEMPFYVVGERTKNIIMEIGVRNIAVFAPTTAQLLDLLPSNLPHRFAYLRGRDVSYDLKSSLERCGADVEENICYIANIVRELPQSCLEAIYARDVRAITFFSKRAAEGFLRMVELYDLQKDLMDVQFLCMSARISSAFSGAFAKQCHISKTPDADGFIDLILES